MDPGDEPLEFLSSSEESTDIENVPRKTEGFNSCVRCVFSVIFDQNSGPKIEWQYPTSIDLSGVEFYALASGLHAYDKTDLVYFRFDPFYGLGVYKRHLKGEKLTRDAVMRSVGVLCEHYAFFGQYKDFLEEFVTTVKGDTLTNSNIQTLQSFYAQNGDQSQIAMVPTLSPSLASNMPSGAVSLLFSTLGSYTFVLWRAIMLKYRVLICGPPPVRRLSYIVYAAALLAHHSVAGAQWKDLASPNPLFCVNVSNDTGTLKSQNRYIACTTESIFEGKKQYYDLYIEILENGVSIKTSKPEIQKVLELNVGDPVRYQSIRSKFQAGQETVLISFMNQINNKLLYELSNANKRDTVLSADDMTTFGLFEADLDFVAAMVSRYNLQKIRIQPKTCCWCC